MEKNAQTFLFKWGVKTADHSDTGVTQRVRQCVGLLDNRFSALDRTEERNQWAVLCRAQEIKIAPRDHGRRGTVSEIPPQCLRIANILLVDMNRVGHIRLVSASSQCFMRNYIQEQEVKMKMTLGMRVTMLRLRSDKV